MEEKYIPTNIRLTEEQYGRLRQESFDTKKSQAEIIREALELRWAQKEKEEKKMVYSVQKPDDYDNGTFCGTYEECLAYIAKNYSPAEVDEANENAENHGWQIARIDEDTDYCHDVTQVTGDDLPTA